MHKYCQLWIVIIYLQYSDPKLYVTPPPQAAVKRREVVRYADGRNWEKKRKRLISYLFSQYHHLNLTAYQGL